MLPRLPMRGLRRSSRLEGRAITPVLPATQVLPQDLAQSSAEYIGEITAELAILAKSARLDMLNYLLSMARLEAERYSRKEKS